MGGCPQQKLSGFLDTPLEYVPRSLKRRTHSWILRPDFILLLCSFCHSKNSLCINYNCVYTVWLSYAWSCASCVYMGGYSIRQVQRKDNSNFAAISTMRLNLLPAGPFPFYTLHTSKQSRGIAVMFYARVHDSSFYKKLRFLMRNFIINADIF